MKRNEVGEADIVISSHGYDDHVRDAVENCHRTEAFFGNYEICPVVQALYNYGLLSPKLVLGSVPEGHYFHSADHVVVLFFNNGIMVCNPSLIPMLSVM